MLRSRRNDCEGEEKLYVAGDINADTRFADVRTVTTGISQLPRRDRANEMCFNCTLLTVVRRSPSSISVHRFRKTL